MKSIQKGFTLIELLVVIAIIAILAAILFPVFAQAKAAAKKTAALSNAKQLNTGLLIYCNDADDVYPTSTFYDAGNTWIQSGAPYTKNTQIFQSTVDSSFRCGYAFGSPATWCVDYFGPGVSFGANAYRYNALNGTDDYTMRGIIGQYNPGFSVQPSVSQTQVSQPANTIALAEKYGSDMKEAAGRNAGVDADIVPSKIMPIALFQCDSITAQCGGQTWGTQNAGLVPDGARPEAKFPVGKRGGAANAHPGGQNCVAFVDGHAKAMKPEATNPDGKNRPQDNMWDATR